MERRMLARLLLTNIRVHRDSVSAQKYRKSRVAAGASVKFNLTQTRRSRNKKKKKTERSAALQGKE
jgi:hypothetical protein